MFGVRANTVAFGSIQTRYVRVNDFLPECAWSYSMSAGLLRPRRRARPSKSMARRSPWAFQAVSRPQLEVDQELAHPVFRWAVARHLTKLRRQYSCKLSAHCQFAPWFGTDNHASCRAAWHHPLHHMSLATRSRSQAVQGSRKLSDQLLVSSILHEYGIWITLKSLQTNSES